jgi:flagellar assembly protein FliH
MGGHSNLTAWERWELASLGADAADTEDERPEAAQPTESPPAVVLPTAAEIERIHQQAHDDGFERGKAEGYQAGLAAGRAEALGEAKRLAYFVARLDESLGKLESAVADELLALAVSLAREVVRQEVAARPESLLQVVREALAQLPHQHAAIYLHPEDASLLRSYLGDQLAHAGHRIHEDLKLARGDCVIEAGGTQVDATVAMRWQRVLAGLGLDTPWEDTADVRKPDDA